MGMTSRTSVCTLSKEKFECSLLSTSVADPGFPKLPGDSPTGVLLNRLESRSLSELTRQIAPPTKNGHASP